MTPGATTATPPIKFTQEEREKRATAKNQHALDVASKIFIACLGAGFIFARDNDNPAEILLTFNTFFGAMSALASTLAVGQFNLAQQSAVHHKIANNYANLLTKLEFSDPDKDSFLKARAELQTWDASTPLEAKIVYLQM